MIASKIVPKVTKSIKRFGVNVEVFRSNLNEFNEPTENEKILEFKGLFSESQHSISLQNADSGQVKKDKVYKLITLIDNDTKLLKEGDTLIIKGKEFTLININNANMLDAYYDLVLEKNNVL